MYALQFPLAGRASVQRVGGCRILQSMRPPRRATPSSTSAIHSQRELKQLIAGAAPVDTTQLSSVVHKLSVVMADYLENGKAIDIVLNPVEILSAIDAAIRESEGLPSPWPDGADARTFFIHGLYDELIQQPSNIFETRLFPDGTARYIPIARATWKACLEKLRHQIVAGGVKRAGRNRRPE